MFDDALRVLAAGGLEVSGEELLDVLWLAMRMGGDAGTLPLAGALRDVAQPAETGMSSSPQGDAEVRAPGAPAEVPYTAGNVHAAAQNTATGPTRPAVDPVSPALPLRVPGARVLPGSPLGYGRSLRPLKQRLPDRRTWELDEVRTVERIAETRLPDIVLRPALTRWLDLAVVVDDGVSMELWQRLAQDISELAELTGAFRTIRTYGLDARSAAAPVLRSRAFDASATTLPTRAVADPGGDTLVLVVTDGVGAGWRLPAVREALHVWAECGPTAIVQALPRRLWAGTGVAADEWRVTSTRPGEPPRRWRVTDPVLPPGLVEFGSVPIPVLELTREALRTWAGLLASSGGSAVLPLWTWNPAPPPGGYAATRQRSATNAVQRFHDSASAPAFRLAAHLAAVAPVSVPVMRLMQRALEPEVDGGHLAEAFLGGLMVREETGNTYDFTEQARTALLTTLPAAELIRAVRGITRRMTQLAGSAPGFAAWVAHERGLDSVAGQPFAWLEKRMLTRLGMGPARPKVVEGSGASRPRGLPESIPATWVVNVGHGTGGALASVPLVVCGIVGGSAVAVTGDGRGRVSSWALESGRLIGTSTPQSSAVRALCLLPGRGTAAVLVGGMGADVVLSSVGVDPFGRITASVRGVDPMLVGSVRVLATLDGQDEVIVVAGGNHGALCRASWDPELEHWRTNMRSVNTSRGSDITGLACSYVNGVPHVVTAQNFSSIRLWNLVSGEPVKVHPGPSPATSGVATTTIDGQPHAVSVDDVGHVSIWNLVTDMIRETRVGRLGSHGLSVACGTVDGVPHAAFAGWAEELPVVNLVTGEVVSRLTGGVRGRLWSSVGWTTLDGRACIVAAGNGGKLGAWHLGAPE